MSLEVAPPGEVIVRRQWLTRPVPMIWAGDWGRVRVEGEAFRYPWAEDEVKLLAWESFEAEGWSWMQTADGEGLGFPPIYLFETRATSDPRYFIADFGLRGDAYHAEDG